MTYQSTVLADSPIGCWKLDQGSGTSAADTSCNGHTGTYVGSPALGMAGLAPADGHHMRLARRFPPAPAGR
jgi:hypothetical protein